MAETPGRADDQKRATWVALRTLRQRPKLVDHGKRGEPIYEIRSVRLVLRENADHFNRLAQCSKCGREVPGAPVLTQADLTRSSHSVICKECVRTATSSAPTREPAPGGSPAPPVTELADASAARAGDDREVVATDRQLAFVMTRLTELADAERAESKQRAEADAELRSEMQAALKQGLRHIQAVVASGAEGEARPVEALEARVSQRLSGLAEFVERQRSEVGALTAALGETRSELQRVAAAQPSPDGLAEALRTEMAEAESRLVRSLDAQRAEVQGAVSEGLAQARHELTVLQEQLRESEELVQAQRNELGALTAALAETRSEVTKAAGSNQAAAEVPNDVGRRLDEITTWVNAQPTAVSVVEALRAEMAQVESRIAGAVEALRAELHVALTEGLTQARVEVASLEQQLRRAVVDLTERVDTQRLELGTAATQEVAAVVERIRDLADSHHRLQGKLDGVLESTFDNEARLNAFAASSEAIAGRMHGLEQSSRESINRLTRLIEGQRRTWPEPPVAEQGATPSLLDALDRQLEEAEMRLARRLSSSHPG